MTMIVTELGLSVSPAKAWQALAAFPGYRRSLLMNLLRERFAIERATIQTEQVPCDDSPHVHP